MSVGHVECLDATIIIDTPKLYHALRISRDEAVEIGQAIDTDERMLMAWECHDRAWQIWIPDQDIKVETATHKHLVLLTVGHLTNSSLMTCQRLDGCHSHITEDIFVDLMVFEIILYLVLLSLLLSSNLAILGHGGGCIVTDTARTVDLFLTQIPKVDFTVVDTCSKLVDVWKILKALDEVIDEPWSMLSPIRDVLLALLVTGHLLLFATARARHGLILVGSVVRVANLRLVIKGEEKFNVPSENGTLGTTGEQELLLPPLDIAETFLS